MNTSQNEYNSSVSEDKSGASDEVFFDIKTRKKRNQMSFTMKRINLKKATEVVNDLNISSFACRADVIYKKVLRDLRRFYTQDLKNITGFKDFKKARKDRSFCEVLLQYAEKVLGLQGETMNNVAFALGALVSPQQLGSTFLGEKKSKKDVNQIHDTLYKFSITKLDSLLNDVNLGYLLKHYIGNQENMQSLITSSKISAESYQTAFDMLETRANAAIAQAGF